MLVEWVSATEMKAKIDIGGGWSIAAKFPSISLIFKKRAWIGVEVGVGVGEEKEKSVDEDEGAIDDVMVVCAVAGGEGLTSKLKVDRAAGIAVAFFFFFLLLLPPDTTAA